jgi:hypothetical protein
MERFSVSTNRTHSARHPLRPLATARLGPASPRPTCSTRDRHRVSRSSRHARWRSRTTAGAPGPARVDDQVSGRPPALAGVCTAGRPPRASTRTRQLDAGRRGVRPSAPPHVGTSDRPAVEHPAVGRRHVRTSARPHVRPSGCRAVGRPAVAPPRRRNVGRSAAGEPSVPMTGLCQHSELARSGVERGWLDASLPRARAAATTRAEAAKAAGRQGMGRGGAGGRPGSRLGRRKPAWGGSRGRPR